MTSPTPQSTQSKPQAGAETFNLVMAWRTVRKHWATALATALAISLGTTFYTLGQTKIYQSNATVQFDPNPPRPLGKDFETVVDMGVGSYWNNREYYETQYKILQSMRVALAVVRELNLQQDPGFLKNAPASAGPFAATTVAPEDAANLVRARLSVEPVKESRLAVVRYEDADPLRAQRILGTLVDTYIDENLNDALSSTTAAVDWLRGQLDTLKNDLESSENALHGYKINKNILSLDLDAQSNMLREEMKQLNDALTGVRTKKQEVSARRTELLKVAPDNPDVLPATELLQSPLLQILRQRFEEAIRDRDAVAGGGKGPQHPELAAADARVGATRAALLSEVRNIQGAVDRDLSAINAEEIGLAGLFDKAKHQALDLNQLEIEYNRLKRSKDNTEKLYSLILERTKESDLTRMMRVNNIRVVDRPLAPRVHIRPRAAINIAVGIVLGLGAGLAAALARALLDKTVKTPDDVERDLGLTFLGLLPEIDEAAQNNTYQKRRKRRGKPVGTFNRDLIVHELPSSGIAEASRAIRTNLMFMAPDHPYKVLLITSASPAEGKTTVACCIAIAMAQAGQRVLLMDCDLRRPRVHRVFGKTSESGVTTALLEGRELDGSLLTTEVPNLSVLAAGPIPPNPAELLQSERYRAFIESLKLKYDRIIIDSPPVVAVTDPTILSTVVDGTILVVRSFKTSRDMVRHASRALMDVGGKVAGVVLNAVNLQRHEYQYYYQYYYRSGSYYGTPPGENDPGAPPPTLPGSASASAPAS